MSTKHNLVYCGMPANGATVREAKQNAARQIETFLTGDLTPTVLAFKGRVLVIWNTPQGVCSAYADVPENIRGTIGGLCYHGSGTTKEQAILSGRLALAQHSADVASNEVPAILCGNPYLIKDFASWLGFQRAYKAAPEGSADIQRHQFACDNSTRFTPTL